VCLALTTVDCSVSFSYGYVLINLSFFTLHNAKYTQFEFAIKCMFIPLDNFYLKHTVLPQILRKLYMGCEQEHQ